MSEVVYGPPFVIDGPVPEPPPYRLLDVIREFDIRGDDTHWQNGVQVYPYPPDLPDGTTPCLEGTFRTKGEGDGVDLPIFGPFALYVADTCSTISVRDPEAFAARAATVMRAVESYGVERQLIAGASQPGNPFVGDTNAVLPFGSTALDPRQALAVLEDAIGGLTAKQGLIHASPALVSVWDAFGYTLIERDGKLFTRRGTPVVVGDGYIGTKPTSGTAAGSHQAWAYASGPAEWRGGEIFMTPETVKEATDRELNVITYRAERQYVVEWDTALQVAVKVTWA